ncbi:zinc finger BED domain-containing protein 6-like [Patiria miniata]|uniref:Uncharacterized protein n=1 Tax=Patiria miniata TaxID=46514 RepID=A0A913ZSC6_PATMI|nr:zinc finger BED domain-containing protein 6-like [Patiria miniata]
MASLCLLSSLELLQDRYDNYLKSKSQQEEKQASILTFATPGASCASGQSSEFIHLYSAKHPRQKAINEAIIKDLIVGCSLPLSLVENPCFQKFMKVVEPKYSPMARSTVTRARLPELYTAGKERIKKILQDHQYVSLTADIWSDRVMRSFLGVTAHVITPSPSTGGKLELQSLLLSCERFHGSHTGERISTAFETLIDEFHIKNKISFIVKDNAANMKKAFKASFPQNLDESDDLTDPVDVEEFEQIDLDDESLWEEMDEVEADIINVALESNSTQRLACFAHTLQLVVGKGLKETRGMSNAIAKACKMASTLHRSTIFKERFETKIGLNRSIPKANATRWNSKYHLLKSILGLNFKTLVEDVCGTEFSAIAFTVHEWGQLGELVEVLEPFADATDTLQGEFAVTVSLIVPTLLDLATHLKKMKDRARYCKQITTTLQDALLKYFQGIYVATGIAPPTTGTQDTPFSDKIYMIASVLDPQYGLTWVDLDVPLDGNRPSLRDDLKETLKGSSF